MTNLNPLNKENLDNKNQKTIGGMLVVLLLFTIFSFVYFMSNKNKSTLSTEIIKKESNFDFGTDYKDIKKNWELEGKREIAELKRKDLNRDAKEGLLNKEIANLKNKLDSYIRDEGEIEKIINEGISKKISKIIGNKSLIDKNANDNNKIENNQYNYDSFNSDDPFSKSKNNQPNNYNNLGVNNGAINNKEIKDRSISIISFRNISNKNSFNVKDYIPAGSYAKAILISAVDASVGISAQSNPRQVLFRITSKAKSAKADKKFLETNIEGCVITGLATGDLSSERVYVRLEKMSCANKDIENHITETLIEGYAADSSDGKTGIAGIVVSREGNLITNSVLAGLIEGVGSGLASKYQNTASLTDSIASITSPTNQQIGYQGLGQGVSNASATMSNYFVKRAEQIQPVISIASGKEVELVFMTGMYLDGRDGKVKSKEEDENNSNITNLISRNK
jgi:hypothetical protein